MKKKKILFITIIMIIILVIVGIVIFLFINNNSRIFNNRINELEQTLISEEEFYYTKENYNVFISVSDSKKKAYVRNGNGQTLEEAILNTKEKIEKIIDDENIEPKWIKIDVIEEEQKISEDELASLLESQTYYVSKGISFDENYEVALLEQELNINNIINYDDGYLNLEMLNEYLNTSNKNVTENIEDYNEVILFDCISYIYDESGVHKIVNNQNNYGRREEDNLDKERLSEIIISASDYLEASVNEDGSFVYEYYAVKGEITDSYNILRHEGTTWSMIQAYTLEQDEELKTKIDLAIKYVLDNAVKYKDDNTVFIKEIDSDELKLGANGIAILMLTEYMNAFNTNEYEELVIKIGNAILEMQNENGSYYHVYEYPDFSEKEEYRTIYYDGEATFALMKLYEFTKDEKWLNAAELAMDYFVDNNYEETEDQWIEYAVNAIVDYIPKKEYFELGLNNMKNNYETLLDNENQSATKLELLATGIEIYDKAVKNNVDVSFITTKGILNAIDIRTDYQLNCYCYPEYAMYFNNPDQISYSFFVRMTDYNVVTSYSSESLIDQNITDSDEVMYANFIRSAEYRIRIDDVQHNINAFYQLYRVYDIIQKYNS